MVNSSENIGSQMENELNHIPSIQWLFDWWCCFAPTHTWLPSTVSNGNFFDMQCSMAQNIYGKYSKSNNKKPSIKSEANN